VLFLLSVKTTCCDKQQLRNRDCASVLSILTFGFVTVKIRLLLGEVDMAFIAAKCTGCGASIQVDSSKGEGVCQHCGTRFVAQKEINNTNISHNVTNMFLNQKESIYDLFKNGDAWYRMGEYMQAYGFFKRACEIDASRYELWYYAGMCIYRHKMSTTGLSEGCDKQEEEMLDCMKHAIDLARTSKQKKAIKSGVLEIMEAIYEDTKKDTATLQTMLSQEREKNENKKIIEKNDTSGRKSGVYKVAMFSLLGAGILSVVAGVFLLGLACFGASVIFFYLQSKEENKSKKREGANLKTKLYSARIEELQYELEDNYEMEKKMSERIEEVKNW